MVQTAGKSIPELPKPNSKTTWNSQQCKELIRITERARVSTHTELNQDLYNEYQKSGDRKSYEDPYFLRRVQLTSNAIYCYGLNEIRDVASYIQFLHAAIVNICDEPTWVVPAHTRCKVDLFNAETAFALAQVMEVVGHMLDGNLVARVYQEIDKRVLTPYEQSGRSEWWYTSPSNWNGVVNSSVGACFLLVPMDPDRAIRGVSQALEGLKHYLNKGFGLDGATVEGVGYWQYGLSYLTAFFEMIRARSLGGIDLLQDPRIMSIASSARKLQLGPNKFAPFGDAEEDKMTFSPGFISRLAERLNQPELRNMLAIPTGGSFSQSNVAMSKSALVFRDLAWWDGSLPQPPIELSDAVLPNTGVARMVIGSSHSPQLVIIAKAGHNGEEHNHCDIGSFVVHFDGENYITDPGKGLYTKQYSDPKTRYLSDWPKSIIHSVPILSQQIQGVGSEYSGTISNVTVQDHTKSIQIDMTKAYVLSTLKSFQRVIRAYEEPEGYVVELSDTLDATQSVTVLEGFMTYLPNRQTAPNQVSLFGKNATLEMTVVQPCTGNELFVVQELEDVCREQKKTKSLFKISLLLYRNLQQQTVIVRFTLRKNAAKSL
ncbi:hypothetical protein K450DRAFT_198475 [Umbelopsis ramanniana AG]|uniref:Heparinase II/III-like protein n=1 Tax=Umbelopsis ramanniana AG TaxID=1314678 RepID=A0AAD5ECV9_UMBRA|nr:uncharacterized protein K450DRAFT_198475 [Umbelopsis ramanniana AG]KAI8580625.1 hypothetical protein K450DRAFT_198475 [Umbelopsis ramanniana AG]